MANVFNESTLEVPKDVRAEVIRELYRQAEHLGWESLSPGAKTQRYAAWIEDPAIGGELADWLPTDAIRVWLKDGPMKEYTRALEGVGSYAEFASRRLAPPDEMIRGVLGDQWEVIPSSMKEKPMHCRVADGSRVRYVCWGKPATYRDLVWAAVNQAIDMDERPLIIVTLREGQEVSAKDRTTQERIAEHCAVDLRYARRALTGGAADESA